MRKAAARTQIALGLALAQGLTSCVGSSFSPQLVAEIENRGTYLRRRVHREMESLFQPRSEYKNVSSSSSIRCVAGALFGTIYGIRSTARVALPLMNAGQNKFQTRASLQIGDRSHIRSVKLRVRWLHPPLSDSESASTITEYTQEAHVSDLAAYPQFFGWELMPEALAEGEWRLGVYYKEELILRERFSISGC